MRDTVLFSEFLHARETKPPSFVRALHRALGMFTYFGFSFTNILVIVAIIA